MIRKICIIAVVGLFVVCYGQDVSITSTVENLPPLPNGNLTEGGPKNFTKPEGIHGGPHGNHTDMGPPKNFTNPGHPNGPPPLPPNVSSSNPGNQAPPHSNGQQDAGKKPSKTPKSSKAPKSSKKPKSSKQPKPTNAHPSKGSKKDAITTAAS